MLKPDTLIVDGHTFSWRRLLELHREQLEAWHAGLYRQLAPFELKDDCRPEIERAAAGRYREPSLFDR